MAAEANWMGMESPDEGFFYWFHGIGNLELWVLNFLTCARENSGFENSGESQGLLNMLDQGDSIV